ncbi:Hypothetical predicted protein, partial [Paramuricea clavata]
WLLDRENDVQITVISDVHCNPTRTAIKRYVAPWTSSLIQTKGNAGLLYCRHCDQLRI